jgi:hypothetical protein
MQMIPPMAHSTNMRSSSHHHGNPHVLTRWSLMYTNPHALLTAPMHCCRAQDVMCNANAIVRKIHASIPGIVIDEDERLIKLTANPGFIPKGLPSAHCETYDKTHATCPSWMPRRDVNLVSGAFAVAACARGTGALQSLLVAVGGTQSGLSSGIQPHLLGALDGGVKLVSGFGTFVVVVCCSGCAQRGLQG